MPLTDVSGKAKALYEARRSRQAIEPFTDADPDLGMADGYAIAQQLTSMLVDDGDTVVGYKVGPHFQAHAEADRRRLARPRPGARLDGVRRRRRGLAEQLHPAEDRGGDRVRARQRACAGPA